MRNIGTGEGTFSVSRGKKMIRGKLTRVSSLVFTTNDGIRGESWKFDHREAYEAAMAAKAQASFANAHRVPVAHETCRKAPPPAKIVFTKLMPKLSALDESTLFAEVERRGYVVNVPC